MAKRKTSEVRRAAGVLAPIIPTLALISCVVNVLALTGSFYMLQIYDRVLSSRSIPTLVALSVLAIGLYLFQGGLEVVRSQVLVRIASRLDRQLTTMTHDAVIRLRSFVGSQANPMQPLRDVDAIRNFLSGQAPVAILDMPWMPLYLAFVFLLHPILGWATLAGALFLISLTFLTERLMRAPTEASSIASRQRWTLAEASEQNAEVLNAMGFAHRFMRRFQTASQDYLAANERLSDIVGSLTVVSRVFRLMLQSALLGLGAYLTISGEMTAGAIIACSIAASRALAPIEVAIANWRGFVAARQSSQRLDAVFASLPQRSKPLLLQPPSNGLSIEGFGGRRAGHTDNYAQQHHFRGQGRFGRGRNRAERGRQVDAGPRHHRRVAPSARRGAPRRGCVLELVVRGAWKARRLLAARRATVRRHHHGEHLRVSRRIPTA